MLNIGMSEACTEFRLGYDERLTTDYLDTGTYVINMAPLASLPQSDAVRDLAETSRGILTSAESQPMLVTSHEPINDDVRNSLLRGHTLGFAGVSVLRTLLERWTLFAQTTRCPTTEWIQPNVAMSSPLREDGGWAPGLFGRYGNVELRVLDNWLADRDSLHQSLLDVLATSGDVDFMYRGRTTAVGNWLSSADADFNLRQLMTNAGFHVSDPERATEALDAWCEAYLLSLAASTALFPYPAAYPNYLFVQEYLAADRGLVDYVRFPSAMDFYASLKDRTLLFVTPFATEIRSLQESGNLFRLFTDIDIPNFRVDTVQAPMAIFPEAPSGSWAESFESLKGEIDRAASRSHPDLFLASAGCYGMPISHFAHSQYGLPSIYFGNFPHVFFGIRQNGTMGYHSGKRVEKNWVTSGLASHANIARIDDGRYV
jgi:hypothetical protein